MACNTRFVAHKRQQSSSPIPSAAKRACIARPGDLPTRTLMNLPIEVRLSILTRALWQSEPLRFVNTGPSFEDWTIDDAGLKPNFRLHVQILRVCRQLHTEGLPILYDNTVGCEYRSSMPDLCSYLSLEYDMFAGNHIETMCTNPGNGTAAPPHYLFAHMRKLDVTLLVVVNKCPHWSHLGVRVLNEIREDGCNPPYWPEINKDFSRAERVAKLLEPFKLLSGLKSANFEGIPHSQAQELQQFATGDSRSDIMPEMLWDLQAQSGRVQEVFNALEDICAGLHAHWPTADLTDLACEEAKRVLKGGCEATLLAAHSWAQSLINKCLKVGYCAYLERYTAQNAERVEEQWQIQQICRSFLTSSGTRMTNEDYRKIIQLARRTSLCMY